MRVQPQKDRTGLNRRLASALVLLASTYALAQLPPVPYFEYTATGTERTIWLADGNDQVTGQNPYSWIVPSGQMFIGQTIYWAYAGSDTLTNFSPPGTPLGVDNSGSIGFEMTWNDARTGRSAPTRQYYRYYRSARAEGSVLTQVQDPYGLFNTVTYKKGMSPYTGLAISSGNSIIIPAMPLSSLSRSEVAGIVQNPWTTAGVYLNLTLLANPYFATGTNYGSVFHIPVSNEFDSNMNRVIDLAVDFAPVTMGNAQPGELRWTASFDPIIIQSSFDTPQYLLHTDTGSMGLTPYMFDNIYAPYNVWLNTNHYSLSSNFSTYGSLQALNMNSNLTAKVRSLNGTDEMPTNLLINWHFHMKTGSK